ncbi:MAG: cyclase family protein [Thermoanaerobaculia bacterium]|nr:cyclase family protein [Thermoanaerobaculia bacterium]
MKSSLCRLGSRLTAFVLFALGSGAGVATDAPPAATATPAPTAAGLNLATVDVVDLSHPFDARTLYWPSAAGLQFSLEVLHSGPTPAGWFYAANRFCTPEHGGTHLDAPLHFAFGKRSVDQVPLRQLVAPGVVIDVREQCAKEADYRLVPGDLAAWEAVHGRIPPGAIVLLRTGWETRWGDRKAYFGDDTPGDATHLHFPSFGADAARWLIEERGIGALGVDTASIDHGPSSDFAVHRIAAAREVPGLENLKNLGALPARDFWVVALPMNIGGGSGAPLRAIALVGR